MVRRHLAHRFRKSFETTCDATPACGTTDLAENTAPPLTICDVAGRVVRRLVDTWQGEGAYGVTWNGIDAAGTRVASGVYVYELQVGTRRLTRKLAVVQ
ncbi:MAG TPA: FlgD immunoglobulin-like domain containing protein [Candidatus Krumholzibacteria bacterium]|nr:FlgD immunoglobulin-like domain containing protein [Candidatus Krumholzibacteria bacterium]